MMRTPAAVTLVAMLGVTAIAAGPATANGSAGSLTQQVKTLRKQNANLRRSKAKLETRITTANTLVGDLQTEFATTKQAATDLQNQVFQLNVDKNSLSGQLTRPTLTAMPHQRASPTPSRLSRPAAAGSCSSIPIRDRADTCGSFYSSGSYWSVTFDPPIGGYC